jgi:hypothetical protein
LEGSGNGSTFTIGSPPCESCISVYLATRLHGLQGEVPFGAQVNQGVLVLWSDQRCHCVRSVPADRVLKQQFHNNGDSVHRPIHHNLRLDLPQNVHPFHRHRNRRARVALLLTQRTLRGYEGVAQTQQILRNRYGQYQQRKSPGASRPQRKGTAATCAGCCGRLGEV